MNRLVLALLVLALAGLLYVLMGDGGGDEVYDEYGLDPFGGAGPGDAPPLLEDTPDPGRVEDGGAGGMLTDGPPKEDKARPEGLVVRGRVVDERRRPVAEAKVSVRLGRRRTGAGLTDAAGHYEISLAAGALRALVVAETEDGRTGTAAVWTSPGASGSIGAPPIVLRPVSDLRVRVVSGADRSGVGGATCVLARRSAGSPVVIGTHRTSGTGQLTVAGLPRGPVEIFAAAPGKGRGHARVTLPLPAGDVPEVVLAGERRLDVLVVDGATRRPIAGAEVLVGDRLSMPVPDGPGYLPPVGPVRTNAQGRATISGLGATKLFVNARAPGYVLAPWWKQARAGVEVGVNEVEIALRGFRSVRFHVDAFAPETPADGTPLTVELDPQSARMAGKALSAYIEDGALIVEGLPDNAVRGTVRAAGGIYANFTAPTRSTDGPDVAFRKARDVVVRLMTPDGDPAAGIGLALHTVPAALRPMTAVTDAEGLAPFRGVGGDAASLHRARADGRGTGTLLAKLDLTEERETYDVELHPRTNLLVRLTVDGEPRLPAEYGLTVDGRPVLPEDVVEDPAAGTLLAPFDNAGPQRTIKVRITPDGYLPADASLVVEGGDIEHEVSFDLRAAGALIARITPPADGQYSVVLEVRDAASGSWTHAAASGSGLQPMPTAGGSTNTRRFQGLAAGTYRVRDPRSGIAGSPTSVVEGEPPPTVTLDLSGVVWIDGRVVAPVGAGLQGARVLIEGKDKPGIGWSGAAVKADGSFRVRVARERKTTLTVTHPTLRPARNGGRVTVRGGDASVTLRLERGGEARFTVAADRREVEMTPGGVVGTVRVQLYRGGLDKEPVRVLNPVRDGGGYRFGGFEPGTYTLVIDIGNQRVPVVKKNVKLGEGSTDLGAIEAGLGSTLRVRLRSRRDTSTRLWVSAVRKDHPVYTRSASAREAGGEAVCTGLGAGTYAVQVRSVGALGGGSGVLYEQDVTVDGSSEKLIEVSGR